jgi:hypothetical protein
MRGPVAAGVPGAQNRERGVQRAGMRNDYDVSAVASSDVFEKRSYAPRHVFERFSALGRVPPSPGLANASQLRTRGEDFVPRQTFPLSERKLPQACVLRYRKAVRSSYDLRRFKRAREVARVDAIDPFGRQSLGNRSRLVASAVAERYIAVSLKSTG